ncbi:MAG: protease modulator HflK [Planctomycetota bacterium]
MTDSNLELHARDLDRLRRVTGWVAIAGPWPFGAAALGVGLWTGGTTLIAVGLFLLVQAVVLTGFWKTLEWREWEFLRLVQNPTAVAGPVPLVTRFLPLLAGGLAIALPLHSQWLTGLADAWEPLAPWARLGESGEGAAGSTVHASVLVAVALLSALVAQYYGAVSRELAPEARGVACWFRAATWIAAAGAAGLFLRASGRAGIDAHVGHVLLAAVVLLGVELTVRALWASWRHTYTEERHPGGGVGTDVFSLRLLCSRFNPSASLFGVLADAFGIDLRGAWALTFMRRSLAPILAGLLVLGWLSTSFVMVHASDLGLVERFGRLDREPLRPGLHVVLPWPMHRVTRVPVQRVQTIPIGFVGAREDASMLWTVAHADEEYKLLLGDGRDLVTVNASLHYRIRDPFAYAYSVQNADEALAILADRVLMQRTVGRSLDEVLSENLAAFGAELEGAIQAESDARALGFEIVDLTLTGLHPPVNVAADYQAVVAAGIDQITSVLEAQAYRETEGHRAGGEVARLRSGAEAHAVTRLATARGEAAAFQALRVAHAVSPQAFGLVRYLQVIEKQLAGKRFHVIDHTIEEAGGAIWLVDQR